MEEAETSMTWLPMECSREGVKASLDDIFWPGRLG